MKETKSGPGGFPACQSCGSRIPPGSPEGLCPRCVAGNVLSDDDSWDGWQGGAGEENSGTGRTIGDYRLLERLGEGGFGEVFAAQETGPLGREVALKVIKPGMDSREVLARFQVEERALAMLDHPGIARIMDAGTTTGGRPYFVMERVCGPDLVAYCEADQLSLRERLDVFVKVCAAVQHAHAKGVIHRDLKPGNILVKQRDGEVQPVVIDFGMAKATEQVLTDKTIFTRVGHMIGTPQYMSPEQAAGGGLAIDARADVYSLGVILYELLTATTPLPRERVSEASYDELLRSIREEPTPRPSTRIRQRQRSGSAETGVAFDAEKLRGDLDRIVLMAVAKDPARRYSDAGALGDDLRCYLAGNRVVAPRTHLAAPVRRFLRRHRTAFVAGAVGLVLGAVALFFLANPAAPPRPEWRQVAVPAAAPAPEGSPPADTSTAGELAGWRALAAGDPDQLTSADAARLRAFLSQPLLAPVRDPIPLGGYLHAAAFHPDGQRVVTAGQDGSLRVFDSEDGAMIGESKDCGASVDCFEFSPDGEQLAAGTIDGTVRFWSLADGTCLNLEPQATSKWVTDLCWHPDGGGVVTTHYDGWLRYRDCPSATVRWELSGPEPGPRLQCVALPDATLVAVTEGSTLAVRSLDDGSLTVRLAPFPSPPLVLLLSGDAGHLWAGCRGGEVYRFDTTAWRSDIAIQAHRGQISSLRLDSSGTRLATSSHDGSARIWRVDDGALLATLPHRNVVHDAIFLAPGKDVVVSGSKDRSWRLWDLNRQEALTPAIPFRRSVVHLTASPDGRRLLLGGSHDHIELWRLELQPAPPPATAELGELAASARHRLRNLP